MKSGPLLFLGVFATLAVSWTSMVLAPQLQIGRMGPKPMATGALYPAARPGLAEQGREVYRQNGCAYCH
ncbi:MAG: cytochrome-c oxidase, partial [Verrucomicrobiota bacterium]